MKKLILFTTLVSLTSYSFGSSCYSVYEEKAEQIRKDKEEYTQLGGEFIVISGHVSYHPGITVPVKVSNWARDYIDAIKYGPELMSWSEENPRAEWLNSLYASIKRDCRLEADPSMTIFRGMLHDLMEDGTMCPDGDTVKRTFLKPRGHFKAVLKDAVRSGRFADKCSLKEIADDSYRVTKKVEPVRVGPSPAGAKSTKQ